MSPFAEQLLAWYDRHGRALPWRRTHDPYEILVSEVMLQQTQVARVIPRYEAFLARFPSAAALAAAPAADVIVEWSGLGYNRRALALHRAAAVVARDGWPREGGKGLEALPGVGPYTAAAVASFAWDEPVAAVDTNARRVFERHDAVGRRPLELERRAGDLLSRRRPAAFNHAVMDLGASVCTSGRPTCGICPLLGCRSRGRIEPPPRRPGAAARPRFEDTDRYARGRILAALAAGRALPSEIAGVRRERALGGLERDGLVVRAGAGVRLP